MTTYSLRKAAADKVRADAVVVGVVTSERGAELAPGGEAVAAAYGRRLEPLLSSLAVTGKAGQVVKVPTADRLLSPMLVLVGLGARDRLTHEGVRRGAGAAARALVNAASVALALPAHDAAHIRAVAEGYRLGCYTFTDFKNKPAPKRPAEVVLLTDAARSKEAGAALDTAEAVAEAAMLARDWVNTPPGDLTPVKFAEAVTAARKQHQGGKLTMKVLDESELEASGYGGILGVGRGSANPPRLVRLTYKPRGAKTHLALVGKGITYDSGGLSIKSAAGMKTMKCDMGGAAAVLAATFAIARLGLDIAVTTYAPMAENMPSGSATRPGDVLRMYGGKTVEVLNTDAEGRLVLADALVTATEQKPDVIVDAATLTGACVTALGERVAGVLGNDPALVDAVQAAGDRAGEALWPLPITEEVTEKVRTGSSVADLLQHNPDPGGGTLFAAAFLQEFVGDHRWAHLDIAGPAFNEKGPHGYTPTGGTGFAVSTLVELARDLAS